MKPHWKPKTGQTYFFVDHCGTIDSFKVKNWKKGYFDRSIWERGNCFQTKEQAKAASKIIGAVYKQIQADSANFPEFQK